MEVRTDPSSALRSGRRTLIPEVTIHESGVGPKWKVEGSRILLTLEILRSTEQESLRISVWGSADGSDFGNSPVMNWPEKFYCGTYQEILDISEHPEIRFLRAAWDVKRWAQSNPVPIFTFSMQVAPADNSLLALCA